MIELSVNEMVRALREKKFSAVELAEAYLERIKDSKLNAFITVTREQALADASRADRRIAMGDAGLLTGIPVAHKDVFCTRGVRTSCGSRMLDNFVAPYDATVVSRLADAGMVSLGKTNMDEFAMGSSNENSYYGPVHNPWDPDRVPGGSSGGSAAAVAARLCPVATATDTGGSIRQPAAFCGVTGIKPTYGRVSRYGMVAYASSLDQAGVIGRSAEDLAMVLGSMAGFDSRDSTSVDRPVPDFSAGLPEGLAGLRIGLPKEYFGQHTNPRVESVVQAAIAELENGGARLKEISLPHTELAVPAYYVVAPAECSSNLARYDGVRYGFRAGEAADLQEMYTKSRQLGFGTEVKRRILIGTYVLSAGYYDAYYLKAQRVRRLIRQDFQDAFREVDLILSPTTPDTAFPFGEKSQDPVAMYLSDVYTVPVNLAGLPALSLPAGFAQGLPVGVQLIGDYFAESRLLQAGYQFQSRTDWHRKQPGGGRA